MPTASMKWLRYGLGALVAAISLVALTTWLFLPRQGVFIASTAIWILLLILLYRFFKKKVEWKEQLVAISIITPITSSGLVSVIEVPLLRWVVIALVCVLLGFLYGSGIAGETPWFTGKPYRRFVTMTWVFNVYAGMSFLFALITFFHSPVLFWIAVTAAGLFSGFIAFMIWRLYFDPLLPPTIIWAIILTLIIVELTWVVHFLPLGYSVTAFFITWIWYLMQLFIRFHLNRGIEWRKQLRFVVANSVLCILLFVLYARWV